MGGKKWKSRRIGSEEWERNLRRKEKGNVIDDKWRVKRVRDRVWRLWERLWRLKLKRTRERERERH